MPHTVVYRVGVAITRPGSIVVVRLLEGCGQRGFDFLPGHFPFLALL